MSLSLQAGRDIGTNHRMPPPGRLRRPEHCEPISFGWTQPCLFPDPWHQSTLLGGRTWLQPSANSASNPRTMWLSGCYLDRIDHHGYFYRLVLIKAGMNYIRRMPAWLRGKLAGALEGAETISREAGKLSQVLKRAPSVSVGQTHRISILGKDDRTQRSKNDLADSGLRRTPQTLAWPVTFQSSFRSTRLP